MEIKVMDASVPAPATTVYRVPREVVDNTIAHLCRYRGREAVCFWIGDYTPPIAAVKEIWIPQFQSTAVSYDIHPEEMLRLRRYLDDRSLTLLAQVHSHPGEAFHSSRDDENAASPWAGFISIVVPNGGAIEDHFFTAAEVYEHIAGTEWRHIHGEERDRRLQIAS